MKKLKPNQFKTSFGAVITEHPILFQGEMVQANLQDRKTQTRRLVKDELLQNNQDENLQEFLELTMKSCPYGMPGDLLWVKETTKVGAWNDEEYKVAFDYRASPELKKTPWVEFQNIDEFEKLHVKIHEKLMSRGVEPSEFDDVDEKVFYHWEPGESPLPWTPSMHMLKVASRIWAMIEEIRVERVQDISEEDAKAEGIQTLFKPESEYYDPNTFLNYTWHGVGGDDSISGYSGAENAKESFQGLWYKINGADSWNSNPWVWVIQYRILSKTGKPNLDLIEKNYKEVVYPPRVSEPLEGSTGEEVSHA